MKTHKILTILALLLTSSSIFPQTFDKNIVGYFVSWGIYARDFHVQDIPVEQINVINYAFANISDGEIVLGDHYADVDIYYPGDCWDPGCERGSFNQLRILKENNPHLKTMISVGGWTWSYYFSQVAATEESREVFASSCVVFIEEHGFDGVDIDWEYPVSGGLPGNIYSENDRENYTLLLAELREQLDAAGDYLLTIAAPASPFIIENLEVELIHQYLDWINIMTYDFHGPWGGEADIFTNFHSPLHASEQNPLDEPFHSQFNLSAAVETYLYLGVPPDKLQPGIPFYGRGYANVENENNGLYSSWSGLPQGTWENGVTDYWDLALNYVNINGFIQFWHDEAMVPWVYNPNSQIMYSFENESSIEQKCNFINDIELGGAMFWEFSGDKFNQLLPTIFNELAFEVEGCDFPGDVNHDNIIDVLDVVATVNCILQDSCNECSDVNLDGTTDVLDIVTLVNIILQ